jgi:hypothetical protein
MQLLHRLEQNVLLWQLSLSFWSDEGAFLWIPAAKP